jgi:hypothetical protein
MKRYILTSPKFTGEINVLYGLDNKLLFIDFMKADLSEHQISFFKKAVPVFFTDQFLEAFPNSNLNVLEEGYQVTFEMWWNRYNLKHNKARCLSIWNAKLSEADRVNAYFKLGSYERHLSLNTWKNKADPDTYLRQRYWESEWK